jgi:BolA-like protein 1
MKRKALEIAADAGGDSTTSQQSAQEVAEPRVEGMENKRTEFAAFGAQEDERSVADMPSQEGQLEEREDKGESGAQAQVRGRRRADA